MLSCVFGPNNLAYARTEELRLSWPHYAWLNQWERECLIPSLVCWNIPTALISAGLQGICERTIRHFVERQELSLRGDFYKVVNWLCQFIDERDPPDIRDLAVAYREDPLEQLNNAATIFRHWVLTRFEGFRCNVATSSNLDWVTRLRLTPTCEGDDLAGDPGMFGSWGPAMLLDDLDEAETDEERNMILHRLRSILGNCLWLGRREPQEPWDSTDVFEDYSREVDSVLREYFEEQTHAV